MKVKFQVFGAGSSSFVSPKSGRTYNKFRAIGMAFDPYDGSSFPAVADLAFDCPQPEIKQNETYLLQCISMTNQDAMTTFVFNGSESFKSPKG